MSNLEMVPLHADRPKVAICKGRIYRARVSAFIDNRGDYVYRERMVLLKRKSCIGCEECGCLDDMLSEFLSNETPPIIMHIEDGALYSLRVVNESRDWESGMIDDWDMEFVKIKKDK